MSTGTDSAQLLDRLNPEQAQAVSLEWGPSLVIAGAGSGKTTVLTRRIAWLISQLGQDPESILAVTFTNKAAGEMKKRVEQLTGADVGKRLTIGTFHSICARMLRREIDQYKTAEGWTWTNNFNIYDETDSLKVAKDCITKLNLDEKVFVPKNIRNEISALKNDGISSARYAETAKTYREQRISSIFSAYQADMARNNALDFDDLINVYIELLKQNKHVLNRQRRKFRHVLVDEFQDTNKAQYDLVSLLSHPNHDTEGSSKDWNERSLMVVGDVDQSIYSWRKADFRIILGFQKDHQACQLIKLEENYRSTSTILEVANSIIENNSERIEKVLRCNRGKGSKAQCFEAQDEIDEANYVAEELKRLKLRGRMFAEAVILYRTNAQSRAIEEMLVRSHIPYKVVGATKFYDRQEIKDVLAYLKLIYNGRDSISFNRIINVPRRGIGKTSLERLAEYAGDENLSMLDAAAQADRIKDLPPKAAGALKEFALLVHSWQGSAGTSEKHRVAVKEEKRVDLLAGPLFDFARDNGTDLTAPVADAVPEPEEGTSNSDDSAQTHNVVSNLLQRVLKETKYIDKLIEDSDKDELAEGRIENIKELVAVAQEFDESADEPDLDSFLTRISLMSDLDGVEAEQDAVTMMTVHSAKGLEYNVVFVMGLEEGLFPHIRSLDSPSAMEEERRLMYVAVTRAADLLYLTLARKRMLMGRMGGSQSFSSTFTIPSPFLREVTPGLLAGYYPSPKGGRQGYEDPHPEETSQEYDEDSNGGRHGNNTASSGGYGGGNSWGARSGGSSGGRGGNDYAGRSGGGYGGRGGNDYAARSGNSGGGSNSGSYGGRSSGSNNSGAGGRYGANPPPVQKRAMRPGDQKEGVTSSRENIRVQIDARPPSAPDNSFEHLAVGDTVQHARFGTGKIVQVIGEQDKEIYNVEFEEAGKRLLDPKFAKLIKLS